MFDVPVWVERFAFTLSLIGVLTIFALSTLAALLKSVQFFPPPSKESWQHKTFMALFRLHLYPLIVLTILTIEATDGIRGWVQFSIGGLLTLIGFGLAFRITFQMGWRNAFGEKRGLVTSGWFARSRNPVYVVTWVGLLGWALIANNVFVSILLGLWALLYLSAPFVEEPWMEKEYGDEYLAYKARTPRFL